MKSLPISGSGKGSPFLAGDELQAMETDGKWYNIKILKDGSGTEPYYIHWVGFNSSYDRYVSYGSIRLPTKANAIAKPETASGSSSASATRISIIYIENKTGKTINYTISGDGMSDAGSVYNNQKGNIKRAPIGATLYIDKQAYIKITKALDGQTITVK